MGIDKNNMRLYTTLSYISTSSITEDLGLKMHNNICLWEHLYFPPHGILGF